MPSYFLAFITALIAVYALTPLVIKFAVKTGAMDKPDPRKVHKKPIPRLGGLAIYLAFMIAVCSMLDFSKEIVGLLLGGTFIVIVGIIDDFISLPAKVKLLGQILAACILVAFDIRIDFITDPFGDFIFLEYLAIPVTIFWIVGITNTPGAHHRADAPHGAGMRLPGGHPQGRGGHGSQGAGCLLRHPGKTGMPHALQRIHHGQPVGCPCQPGHPAAESAAGCPPRPAGQLLVRELSALPR